MTLITNHMHNEHVVDQHQDALGPLLAIMSGGWVALLVGSLIYREITKGELFETPFLVTLGALLAATVARGNRWPRVATWLLVAGLLAGPACFALLHSSNPAVLVLLALPVVAASMLLPRAATWSEPVTIINKQGTSSAVLTIRGEGMPVFRGASFESIPVFDGLITIDSSAYVTVTGIRLENSGWFGFEANKSNNIVFDNNQSSVCQ